MIQRALLAMAYILGFRRAKLVGRVQPNQSPMLVKQIDLKNCTIRLLAGFRKNNEGRVVRMTEEVYTLLQACVEGKKTDAPLFTWKDGS
jgi:hypothetical protein